MTRGESIDVELSAFLRDMAPEQFNVGVPAPIAERADQLVETLLDRARALGAVSRGELVAALIHDAPADAGQLRAKVEQYREAQVWQTILGARRKTGRIVIQRRSRGRPRRGAS